MLGWQLQCLRHGRRLVISWVANSATVQVCALAKPVHEKLNGYKPAAGAAGIGGRLLTEIKICH